MPMKSAISNKRRYTTPINSWCFAIFGDFEMRYLEVSVNKTTIKYFFIGFESFIFVVIRDFCKNYEGIKLAIL
jgi:hypothetical protein